MSTKSESLAIVQATGSGDSQERIILAYLKGAPHGRIRDAICSVLGIRVSSACAALHGLVERGLVKDTATGYNADTKRRVKLYEAL